MSAAFRRGSDAHTAAVDVRWDQPAKADSGGSGSAELVTLDGVAVECLTPDTGSMTKSGGVNPGGNNTTKWTMSCGPIKEGKYANQRPSRTNIARVLIFNDCAADKTHTYFNALEQLNISSGGKTTNLPDLVKASFTKYTKDRRGRVVSRIVYTFSKKVTLLKKPDAFGFIPSTGGGDAMIANSSGPFAGDEPKAIGNTVRVYYPRGALRYVVAAYVDAEGVESGKHLNQPGEFAKP